MSAWDYYLRENVDPVTARHVHYQEWTMIGVWQFQHDDGTITPHKCETPHAFWSDAIDAFMENYVGMSHERS